MRGKCLGVVMLLHALEIRSLLGIGSWMGRCGVEGEYFFFGGSRTCLQMGQEYLA